MMGFIFRARSKPVEHVEDGYPPLPLDNAKREIRLLKLRPGAKDSQLCGTLEVVDLDNHPRFEALSYTWGDEWVGKTIILNGYRIGITKNVYHLLCLMRTRRPIPTMWIDFCCINQSDIAERSRQVALMGDIYRNAISVSIWLGNVDYNPVRSLLKMRLDFDVLSSVLHELKYIHKRPGALQWCLWQLNPSRQIRHALCQIYVPIALKSTTPYWFQRQWVQQEYVLARKAFLCLGSKRLSIQREESILHPILRPKEAQPRAEALLNTAFQETIRDLDFLAEQIEICNNTLLSALGTASSKAATDQRDKVYSLLGMVREDEAAMIQIDYTLPVYKVYAQATFATIKADVSFAILEQMLDVRQVRPHGLPSWTVDLTLDKRDPALGHWITGEPVEWPGDAENDVGAQSLSSSLDELTIRGVTLDTIMFTSELQVPNTSARRFSESIQRKTEEMMAQLERFTCHILDTHGSFHGINELSKKMSNLNVQLQVAMAKESGITATEKVLRHLFNPGGESAFPSLQPPLGTSVGTRIQEYIGLYAGHTEAAASGFIEYWNLDMFVTKDGFFGLAPSGIQSRDHLILSEGAKMPFILRQDGSTWVLRGFAMVPGIMSGELMELWESRQPQFEEFVLK